MDTLFSSYAPLLRTLTEAELDRELADPQHLRLAHANHRGRELTVAYAPFDHVNADAEVVIVGITPGRQQARNALLEARRRLLAGESEAAALAAAKTYASFSGSMRGNLVAMLDDVGLATHLGLTTTASLWERDAHRVHFTSALRYPVFVDGGNYTGAPEMTATPLLRTQLLSWLGQEMTRLPNAVFVPLGPKVAAGVAHAASEGGIDQDRILAGLPHPSGANAERIAFFLGRKRAEDLSPKTDPETIRTMRAATLAQIGRLKEAA